MTRSNPLVPVATPDRCPAGPALTSSTSRLDTGVPLSLSPLPLIPEAIRRKHHAFVPADGRFKQAARFLQALWREERNLAIGTYRDGTGKVRKLGSMLTAKAGLLGANFLDAELLPFVNRNLVYRDVGAVFDLDRLRRNLLSSQPLVFNAFLPLQRDLALATRVCGELFPGLIRQVTQLTFECSPGRGNINYTSDNSAFDLIIHCQSFANQRVVICIEVKYSENLYEPLPRFSGRYDQIASSADLFIEPTDPRLRMNPIQQLFREHCLASTIIDQNLADVAVLALVAPAHNHLVQAAASLYASHLLDSAEGRIPFVNITLEQMFAALSRAGLPEHAAKLHRRYTEFSRIDAVIDLGTAVYSGAGAARTVSPAPPAKVRRQQSVRHAKAA